MQYKYQGKVVLKFILHYYKLYIENRVKTLVIWSFYKPVEIKNIQLKKLFALLNLRILEQQILKF